MDALADGLTAWLRHEGYAGVEVTSMVRPEAGHAGNTRVVDLSDHRRVVLRLPPEGETHLGDTLERQARVQNALGAAGIPVPAPASYEPDVRWLGSPFVVMPFVDGHVGGEVPAVDEWITGSTPSEQAGLYDAFVDVMARVHGLGPEVWGSGDLAAVVRGVDDQPIDHVDYWRHYLAWATNGAPPPRLVAALDRCADAAPRDRSPRSVLWGDPRLGNTVFDDDRRVVALIDWETACIGPAELDVGYWLGLEAVLDEVMGRRVDGFPDRAVALARYEAGLGRDLMALDWFEQLGLLSAACMSVRLSVLATGRVPTGDELAAHPVVARVERLQGAGP